MRCLHLSSLAYLNHARKGKSSSTQHCYMNYCFECCTNLQPQPLAKEICNCQSKYFSTQIIYCQHWYLKFSHKILSKPFHYHCNRWDSQTGKSTRAYDDAYLQQSHDFQLFCNFHLLSAQVSSFFFLSNFPCIIFSTATKYFPSVLPLNLPCNPTQLTSQLLH